MRSSGLSSRPYASAYKLIQDSWAGQRYTSSGSYFPVTVSQPDESFSSTWESLDTTILSGSGAGMMKQYIRNTVPESYYMISNLLGNFGGYNSTYYCVTQYASLTGYDLSGRNGSFRYTVQYTSGYTGMQAQLPFYTYADGSGWYGFRPSHTYRVSGWMRSISGNLPNAGIFVAKKTQTGSQSWVSTSLKTLTEGKGPDVIYDPVGGDLAEAAFRSIAWRGRYLVIGFAQGAIPALPLNLALLKGASLVGVFWGEFAKREPGRNARMLAELAGWYATSRIKPVLDRVLPMAQLPDAFARMAAREVVGKVVLTNA